MQLYYPVKPFKENQGFGANPDYYAKFHDQFGNPYKGHDGIDFYAIHGEPVYAPMDGLASYSTDVHGGEGVTIFAPDTGYSALHWHLIGDTDPKYPQPFRGTKAVKVGELIGYADNTGAPYESSGDHLHFGLKPVDKNGNLLEPGNGFNGAVDPTPFFNGKFASDLAEVSPQTAAIVEEGIQLAQEAIQTPSLWSATMALLKSLSSFLTK